MKNVNFRIIELPTHQILLTKDFDNDSENTPLLTVTLFLEGVKVFQKFSYHSEEARNDNFYSFTDENAQSILNSVLEMFNS